MTSTQFEHKEEKTLKGHEASLKRREDRRAEDSADVIAATKTAQVAETNGVDAPLTAETHIAAEKSADGVQKSDLDATKKYKEEVASETKDVIKAHAQEQQAKVDLKSVESAVKKQAVPTVKGGAKVTVSAHTLQA